MHKRLLLRKKFRHLFEENIYFTAKQACDLLGIESSRFSRQLKNVLKIPGCEAEVFARNWRFSKREKYERRNLKHYNLNTVVAIAYRINNERSREFLEMYHRVMVTLRVRLVGSNYYVASILEADDFLVNARLYSAPLKLDFSD